MIHVIATIELHAGKRERFLEEFHRIVPQVRAERGCLEYGPAIDLTTDFPAQPAVRADVVTVIEKWDDLNALRDHMAAPHMQEYRGRVKDLVQRVQLHVMTPA